MNTPRTPAMKLLKAASLCHLKELNNRLAAEITKMRSMTSEDGVGDTNTTIQGKELYELEVRFKQSNKISTCA